MGWDIGFPAIDFPAIPLVGWDGMGWDGMGSERGMGYSWDLSVGWVFGGISQGRIR